MARELSVIYGPVTIGGTSTDFLLDGFTRHSVADGKAESYIEFAAVVVSSTAEGFAALCAALERTFRTPRLELAVVQSGVTLLTAAHAAATGGFNTEPEIRKVGDVGDSGRSRRYALRVRYETPADTASTSGLRESTVNVDYDAARIRTVKIAGTFTGVPGTASARARYEAAIAAHAASVLSALSVTSSELSAEPVSEHDYDDKVLRFERTYKELVFGQGQDAANDDADIVDQSLSVSRRESGDERSPVGGASSTGGGVAGGGGGQTGSVQALAVFDLRYEATITKGTSPKAKYDSIRAWLLGQFNAAFRQGAFALTVERVDVDRVQNKLAVEMTAEGAVRGVDFVRRVATSEKRRSSGVVFRGAWTGDPLSHYAYQGFETLLRVTAVTTRYLATKTQQQAEEAAANDAGAFGGGSGTIIEESSSATPVRIGIEGSGHTLDMIDATATVTRRIVHAVGGGGGGFLSVTNANSAEVPGGAIFAGGVAGAGNAASIRGGAV